MRNTDLEKLVWVLIYGGLGLLCLGLFIQRQDAAFGWTLAICGGAAALLGVVLIVVRARRPD